MDNDSYIRARDGVRYNRTIAEAAEAVAADIEHPEIQAWATSVGKQHRFHEQRFQGTLDRLEKKQASEPEGTAVETEQTRSIAEEQAAFAAQQEASQEAETDSVLSQQLPSVQMATQQEVHQP